MIAQLQGLLLEKKPPYVWVNVQGVGYEIAMPLSCLTTLPEIGTKITVYTHLAIREDGHFLYGFSDVTMRDVFRILIRINGIGPKMALAILSSLSITQLQQIIAEQDIARFTKIPGVGKKTANRLLVELSDKLIDLPTPLLKNTSIPTTLKNNEHSYLLDDAVSALVSLGYRTTEASQAVKRTHQPDMNLETLIRVSLQSML